MIDNEQKYRLLFENNNVPIDYILQIGEIIQYDFSDEIKELKKYKLATVNKEVNEGTNDYLFAEQSTPDFWKNKYLELLEKYNQLLEANQPSKTKQPKKKEN